MNKLDFERDWKRWPPCRNPYKPAPCYRRLKRKQNPKLALSLRRFLTSVGRTLLAVKAIVWIIRLSIYRNKLARLKKQYPQESVRVTQSSKPSTARLAFRSHQKLWAPIWPAQLISWVMWDAGVTLVTRLNIPFVQLTSIFAFENLSPWRSPSIHTSNRKFKTRQSVLLRQKKDRLDFSSAQSRLTKTMRVYSTSSLLKWDPLRGPATITLLT